MKKFVDLEKISSKIRISALEETVRSGRGHLGGTYSCVEILVYLYYGGVLKVNPKNPNWSERDRFILGKGHACLALYPILVDLGFMPAERLQTYGKNGGLGTQLDYTIPGVDWNTGSLGHALGVCAGIALSAKLENKLFSAYAVLGDAECEEGAIWETITFAGEKKLNNLIGIIDRNRLSVTETLDDDSFFKNYTVSLNALGWDCFEVDGHSFNELSSGFKRANKSKIPTMIICNTIKGKGVHFMENKIKWHHSLPTKREYDLAVKELKRR